MNTFNRIIVAAFVAIAFGAGIPAATAGAQENADAPPPTPSMLPTPYYGKYKELPIRSIYPEGWLRQWLQIQKDGLTGHPEVMRFPFDTGKPWGEKLEFDDVDDVLPIEFARSSATDYWAPWELGAYVNGLTRAAYLLRDSDLISKAQFHTAHMINHFGERDKKSDHPMNWGLVMRALIAEYSVTKNPKIVEMIASVLRDASLNNISGRRCNSIIEIYGWVYEQTGDKVFLQKAIDAYKQYGAKNVVATETEEDLTGSSNKKNIKRKGLTSLSLELLLSDAPLFEHGYTVTDIMKQPAILFMHNGDRKYLDASINAVAKLERDNMLVFGTPHAEENLYSPVWLGMTELCTIVDYMWSIGYILLATGDVKYADKLEKAMFNSYFGAVGKDFKTHQYMSCPNQVIVTHTSYFPRAQHPPSQQAYMPGHMPVCCSATMHMGLPNYISRMWLKGENGAIAAALYGPSRVQIEAEYGRGPFEIVQETDYPFSETVKFRIKAAKPVEFPLHLRIPEWCFAAGITVNDKPISTQISPGSFAVVERKFMDGDVVELRLPMQCKTSQWFENGIAIERGPLVYSLKIKEKSEARVDMMRGNKEFPAYNYTPESEWRYAWTIPDSELAARIKVVEKPMPANPWEVGASPIELKVSLVKVISPWEFLQKPEFVQPRFEEFVQKIPRFIKGENRQQLEKELQRVDWWKKALPPGPMHPNWPKDVKVSEKPETLTLVPMGGTHLRLTVFPMAPAFVRDQPGK